MTLSLTPRQQREKQIYDQLANETEIPQIGQDFPLPNREHADFFPFFLKNIKEVAGKKVLEIGSGNGYLSCWLAQIGAQVEGIDISEKFVKIAQETAKKNNLQDKINFQIGVAEKLPFPGENFDIVIGNQILHHLEIRETTEEIVRVLKPWGTAVFCEPIGFSKTMEKIKTWTKKKLNHSDHRHTPDEKILDQQDLEILKKPFRKITWRGFQLFATKLARLTPLPDLFFCVFLQIDKFILRLFPFLKRWARLAVIVLEK